MSEKLLLKGVGASSGIAKGRARIVLSCKDASNFNKGEILVASLIDPTFSLAILKAGAIVVEVSGTLSHPAIIARELGIPCVTGAKNATKILKNNQGIIVDGNKGVVYKL